MSELDEDVYYTTFAFDEDDRVRLYGNEYRVKPRPDGLGYIFSPIGERGEVFQARHLEISRLISKRELKVDRKWFAEENAFARAEAADHRDLPSYAVTRYLMVTKFLEGYNAGTWKKTAESAEEFYKFWDNMRQRKRGGTQRDEWDPLVRVTPRQFLRHVADFLKAGRNPYALVRNYSGKSMHKSKFADDVREIAYEYILKIPDAKRPEASDRYDDFLDDPLISLIENKEEIPSRRTFQRWAEKRLQDLHLALAHRGSDACWFPRGTEPVFPPRSEPPLSMVF